MHATARTLTVHVTLCNEMQVDRCIQTLTDRLVGDDSNGDLDKDLQLNYRCRLEV